jgi:hypothetical protein
VDELEFEVTPTDSGRWPRVLAPMRRRPPRALTATLIGLCVVLVAAALILSANPNLSSRLGVLLHGTPTPTPTLPPIPVGGGLLYFEGGLPFPWGQIHIDGELVALDTYTSTATPSPIFLNRGVHTVVYSADPFPPLRCRLTVPASPKDTCPLDKSYPSPDNLPFGARRALNLTPSLDSLSPSAHQALLDAVSAYLRVQTSPVAVPVGARYVDASHHIVVATQPLRTAFTQQLATTSATSGDPCAALCIPSASKPTVAPPPAARLTLQAYVSASFRYTTANGQLMLDNGPISDRSDVSADSLVSLTTTWDGSWHFTLFASAYSPTCLAGERALQPYLTVVDPQNPGQPPYAVYSVAAQIVASNPSDGCLFRMYSGSYGSPPPNPYSLYYHVLYRFGVLLAVDDLSNLFQLQQLPRANAQEAAFAQQLDATAPYN